MKKLVYGLFCLMAVFLVNCEKEKIIPGEVGIPVYLVPKVGSVSDTTGCSFNWSFVERPTGSALNILSFQPSSEGYNIYFIPDVSGNFRVKCKVLGRSQKVLRESVFLCKIKENETTGYKSPVSGTVADNSSEVAPVYLEDKQAEEKEAVKPEPIEKKAPAPKREVPATAEKGLYTIQISSFKTYENAERELNNLKKMGMEEIFIKKSYIKSKDEVWYRIRTKSYPNMTTAKAALSEIKTKYKRKTAWIDRIN